MKRTEPQSVGQIIDEALASSGLRGQFDEQQACFLWASVMGPEVNRRTQRRWVSQGVLHVVISSGPLKQELLMAKSSVIRRLNAAVGRTAILDLRIH